MEPAFSWATRRLASPAPLPPAGEGGAQRRVRARLLILRVRAIRGSRPSALLPRAAFELQALALPDGVAWCLEVVGPGQNLGVARIPARDRDPGVAAHDVVFAGLACRSGDAGDRKSAVSGRSVSGRVDLGGRRAMKKKQQKHKETST